MKNRRDNDPVLVVYKTKRGAIYPKLIFERKELEVLKKSSLIKEILHTERITDRTSTVEIGTKINEILKKY